jgi:site-specific recombinase XerD
MATYTTRFEVRKDKQNKKGEIPISLIISVSTNRKRVSTGISILPVNWDQEQQRAVYITKKECERQFPDLLHSNLPLKDDVQQINFSLENIEKSVNDIVRKFRLEHIPFDSDMISKVYNDMQKPVTKKAEPENYIFDFIENYIKVNEPIRAKNSLGVYKSLKNHLKDFQSHRKNKIRFEDVNYGFFTEFQGYLIEHKPINNVTIAKQLSTLKTFLGYARRNGIKINDSYRDFIIKKQPLEVISLTESEYQAVKMLDLSSNGRLDRARDIFVFMCATSMRYSDYSQFRREHIRGQEIKLTMKKTQKPWEIPLNQDSQRLLVKYKDLHRPLPTISNQKLSEYIKEVSELAGITEPIEIVRYKGAMPIPVTYKKFELISAHTGRKTFCTLSLERGANAESVMRWSGHESYASFKRYINISRSHKIQEMERVWGAAPIMKIG